MPRRPRPKPMTANERQELRNAAEREAIREAAHVEVASRVQLVEELERWRRLLLTDFFELDDSGRPARLLPLTKMQPDAQRMIRKIRIVRDAAGHTVHEIEFYDGLRVRELVGKALGLWRDGEIHEHRHMHLHAPLREMSDTELSQQAGLLPAEKTA